jgi:hypothetical protein
MIRLLGWGGESVPPRAAARGFVPQLETLDGRVVPSVSVAGIKGELTLASGPGVAVQQRIESPPDVVLLGAPGDPSDEDGAAAAAHVPGSGEAGFHRDGGTWYDIAKTDKDKFEPYLTRGDFAPGSGSGVAVQQRIESPPPAVGLVAAPASPEGADGLTAPVHLPGSGEAGFDRVAGTLGEGKKVKIDFCVADEAGFDQIRAGGTGWDAAGHEKWIEL